MRQRKLSSAAIVGLTALGVVVASLMASAFGLFAKTVDPRVSLERGRGSYPQRTTNNRLLSGLPMRMEGEVAHTADRMRDATALALSTSLYASTEQLQGRTPRSVRDLLAGVAQKGLLPPGLEFTNMDGTLRSAYGTLAVRYRLNPLAIEVVSVSNRPEDGPALIVRVPDETSREGEAKLYLAGRLQGVSVPAPFAPDSEVIALGWNPERLRLHK